MNTSKFRLITAGTITFSALLLAGLVSTIYAQKERSQADSAEDPVVSGKRLGTVPSSGSKIMLRLTFDNGAVFTVAHFEGGMTKIKRNGSTIGIAARINTEQWNQVTAKIFKVVPVEVQGKSLGESIAEIGTVDIAREASELPNGEMGVKVEVIGIVYEVKVGEGRNESSRFRPLAGEGGECCLTCSGITVCDCYVAGSCGSCCVGACCNGSSS
ncbi:MAG: hypothetical protein AABO41_22145 [Acidobacteriota bacterium]